MPGQAGHDEITEFTERTSALDVDLYPSMNYIKTAEGIQPTAGLTLAFRF